MAPRPLIAGNWKMNLARATAEQLVEEAPSAVSASARYEMAVFPPAPYIAPVQEALGSSGSIAVGGQDCHSAEAGAHTGDTAAVMLSDLGCQYVLVGHSERRTDHHESDAVVQSKAQAARTAGLVPVICIGETEAERDAGDTLAVISRQVDGSVPPGLDGDSLVIAYEPVWAIGTGRTPTTEDVASVHHHIKLEIAKKTNDAAGVRLLYGDRSSHPMPLNCWLSRMWTERSSAVPA